MRPFTRVIAAGATSDIPVTGNFVFVQSTNLPVAVRMQSVEIGDKGGGIDIEVQMANRQSIKAPRNFDHVHLRNDNASEVTIVILCGFGEFQAPLSTISTGGANTLGDQADFTALAAAATLIAADGNRTRVHIKANIANTQNIRVGTGTVSATRGSQLGPGEGLTLETNAAVSVIREASGTVQVNVSTESNV